MSFGSWIDKQTKNPPIKVKAPSTGPSVDTKVDEPAVTPTYTAPEPTAHEDYAEIKADEEKRRLEKLNQEYKDLIKNIEIPGTTKSTNSFPVSTFVQSSTPSDRGLILESIKRTLTGPNIREVPDYIYNTEMLSVPDSRQKMWDMAIARKSQSGAKLLSSKFNGGQYGI